MAPKNTVPEGWLDYTAMGRLVPGTRFITFKVPLREEILRRVGQESWFCPRTLTDHCHNLGLVIDLTNTTRYYNSEVFSSQGIGYAKVKTQGHVIPQKAVVHRFFNVVNLFLKNNKENDKVIGVHCTHGLNRTGYLVCRYMIQQLGIPPDQAITDFNSARGHNQERKNYLDDLREASWLNDVVPELPASDCSYSGESRKHNNATPNGYTNHYNESSPTWRSSAARRWSTSPRDWKDWSDWEPRRSPRLSSPRHQVRLSPHGARSYYDQRYQGRVAPQYDAYFYQRQGSGIGPHRAQSRWARNQLEQQVPHNAPRQYRGPRQYRSPIAREAPTPKQEESSEGPTAYPDLPRTPYFSPEGPKRNPLSPGAQDDVFSPLAARRRSSRWNPY